MLVYVRIQFELVEETCFITGVRGKRLNRNNEHCLIPRRNCDDTGGQQKA